MPKQDDAKTAHYKAQEGIHSPLTGNSQMGQYHPQWVSGNALWHFFDSQAIGI